MIVTESDAVSANASVVYHYRHHDAPPPGIKTATTVSLFICCDVTKHAKCSSIAISQALSHPVGWAIVQWPTRVSLFRPVRMRRRPLGRYPCHGAGARGETLKSRDATADTSRCNGVNPYQSSASRPECPTI